MRGRDCDYFQELQTQTGWSRTLYGFALWCSPKSGWLTLDVGCGPGLLPAIFSKFGCWAVGVDLEMEVLHSGGKLAMLNPSEHLNEQSALDYEIENSLNGVARDTLLNWARREVENHHWTEEETINLYKKAGMKCMASTLKVGPGFGRFSWGMA